MKITKLLLSAIVAMSCCTLTAQDFDTFFNNKTLRLDYIFGADTKGCHVMLDKQAVLPEWSGRRHRLKELPLAGKRTDNSARRSDRRHHLPPLILIAVQ